MRSHGRSTTNLNSTDNGPRQQASRCARPGAIFQLSTTSIGESGGGERERATGEIGARRKKLHTDCSLLKEAKRLVKCFLLGDQNSQNNYVVQGKSVIFQNVFLPQSHTLLRTLSDARRAVRAKGHSLPLPPPSSNPCSRYSRREREGERRQLSQFVSLQNNTASAGGSILARMSQSLLSSRFCHL